MQQCDHIFFLSLFFFRHFVGVGGNGVGGGIGDCGDCGGFSGDDDSVGGGVGVGGNGDGGGVGVGGNGVGGGVSDGSGSGGGVSGVGVFGEGSSGSGSGGGDAKGGGGYPVSISINNSYCTSRIVAQKCGVQAKTDFSPLVNNTLTTLTFI